MDRRMMRNRLVLGLLLIALLLLIPLPVGANPSRMPDLKSDANVLTQNGTTANVYLDSEDVRITIRSLKTAEVRAEYVIRNAEPFEVRQVIYLPFLAAPGNVRLEVDGEEEQFNWTQFEYTDYMFTYTNTDFLFTNLSLSAIQFYIDIVARSESCIVVTYARTVQHHTGWGNMFRNDAGADYYKYVYLTRTGLSWNHWIRYAKFTFSVPESLVGSFVAEHGDHDRYWSGYFDGARYENGSIMEYDTTTYLSNPYLSDMLEPVHGYYVFSAEYWSWTPEKNIAISWLGKLDTTPATLYSTAIVVTFAVILTLILARVRRKQYFVAHARWRHATGLAALALPALGIFLVLQICMFKSDHYLYFNEPYPMVFEGVFTVLFFVVFGVAAYVDICLRLYCLQQLDCVPETTKKP